MEEAVIIRGYVVGGKCGLKEVVDGAALVYCVGGPVPAVFQRGPLAKGSAEE